MAELLAGILLVLYALVIAFNFGRLYERAKFLRAIEIANKQIKALSDDLANADREAKTVSAVVQTFARDVREQLSETRH